MAASFFEQLLTIDLSQGTVKKEPLPPQLCRDHLGGYGLGVRLLCDRMAPGADPLGPDNILGLFPGLLTGSGVVFSGRFMVTAKSPLTGGWGESNCDGHFGPVLRSAGLDGLLVTGASPRPVYLAIDGGQAKVRDASHLWGQDTAETEQRIKEAMGRGTQVVSLGAAGEKRVLLSSIITDGGRALGPWSRHGLQASQGDSVRGGRKLPGGTISGLRGETTSTGARWLGMIPIGDTKAQTIGTSESVRIVFKLTCVEMWQSNGRRLKAVPTALSGTEQCLSTNTLASTAARARVPSLLKAQ